MPNQHLVVEVEDELRRMTGDDLGGLIARTGVTQFSLARTLGVQAETVRRWLRGERKISSLTAIAIRSVLEGGVMPTGRFQLTEGRARRRLLECPSCTSTNVEMVIERERSARFVCDSCGHGFETARKGRSRP